MSQYPPPPPPQNYPPQGYPPTPPGQGYPPSGYPPEQPYGYPPPKGSNGAAIASLIFGILLCIPLLAGLLAIILGFVGRSKAKDPRFGGGGMAVAGILLGFLNLVGWGLIGCGTYAYIKPANQAGHDFIAAMSKGDVSTAAKFCHSTMAPADLQRESAKMRPWGNLKDTTFSEFHAKNENGVMHLDLGGTATFDNATKKVKLVLVDEAGQWKVVEFNFP
jgi:Domain of unknown function (DUF4190)